MKNDYIVVIDSGIGGLSTLAECIRHNRFNYYYVADNKNIPYGTHSQAEIQQFLTKIITNLKKFCDFKIVILACNTATTTSIEFLRKRFSNLVFIGTEPAIKLAYNLGYKNVLVLTTPATATQNKFNKLISAVDCSVRVLTIESLAKNIEDFITRKSYFSYAKLLKNIMEIVHNSNGCDCVVLGCTHYVFLKKYLAKFTKIQLLDGNAGVQKQLSKVSDSAEQIYCDKIRVKFDNTSRQKCSKQIYKKILSQILANGEDL